MIQQHTDLQTFYDEATDVQRQKQELEQLKREMELRQRSLEQRESQFNMKWNLLLEETKRLAEDKKAFQRKMEFFARVERHNQEPEQSNLIHGEMFFQGVSDEITLKKRYKDLIKIYHPDTVAGDKATVQEINKEYHRLKKNWVNATPVMQQRRSSGAR